MKTAIASWLLSILFAFTALAADVPEASLPTAGGMNNSDFFRVLTNGHSAKATPTMVGNLLGTGSFVTTNDSRTFTLSGASIGGNASTATTATNLGGLTTGMSLLGYESLIGNRNYARIAVATNGIGDAVTRLTSASLPPMTYGLVYVPNGNYNEEVDLGTHPWVDIVGQSRTGVVWSSSSTSADTLKMGGINAMLANLTITHTTAPLATQQYPIHMDVATINSINDPRSIIYNVTSIANGGNGKSAIGIGLYANQSVYLVDSSFSSDSDAGIFIHNTTAQGSPAYFYIINCEAVSTNYFGLKIQNQNSGQYDLVSVIGGSISGPTNSIYSFNNVGSVGEIVLAMSTNGAFAPSLSGAISLTNAMRWVTFPTFPPIITTPKYLLSGAPISTYSSFLSLGANLFVPFSATLPSLALWTAATAATDTGPNIAFGNGGNNVPFAKIEGDNAGGTYAGYLKASLMTEGVSYAEGWRLASGGLSVSRTITPTNGLVLVQLPWIPTNYIPASVSGTTNWVLVNLSNTVAGTVGGPAYVSTNFSAAGSFNILKPTMTQTTWP